MASASSSLENTNLVDSFRATAEVVANRLGRYGLTTRAYLDPSLPRFRELAPIQQRNALDQLKVYLQSIELAEANGDRFDDTGRALWYALSALGLVPPSNLFDQIPAGSAIEIYDSENIQIWRNWEVMRVCGYTIEEIHCLEWHRRYERDPAITAQCFELVGRLMAATSDIIVPDVPGHDILESCSQERFHLSVRFQLAARLNDRQGKTVAFLLASEVPTAYKTRELPLDDLKPYLVEV
ncbi:MAG: hypothetical protein V4760_17475 [Bdellovibrionota bacterium]